MLYLPSRNRLQRQKTVRLSTKWEVKFLQHLFVDSQPIPTVQTAPMTAINALAFVVLADVELTSKAVKDTEDGPSPDAYP